MRASSCYEYNRTMMHHKIMMIDGLWSTVGTSNFDNRSFSHNEESNVSVSDEGVARELIETFERDLAVCDRVTKETWQRRGLPHKPSRRWRRSCRTRSRPQKAQKAQNISPKKSQNHSLILPSKDRCLGHVAASRRFDDWRSVSKSLVSCAASSGS